jgi:hypothetical protein
VQGGWPGKSIEEYFVGVRMLQGILQISLARLGEGSGASEGGKEFDAGLDTQGPEDIVSVVITLVNGGSGGAGCFGNAAHRERSFAAPGPQAAGGIKDALFELGICLSGQPPASAHRQEFAAGPPPLLL